MKDIQWKIQDTLALFVIPLEFLLSIWLASSALMQNKTVSALLPFTFKLLSLVIIAILFHQLLKDDWKVFKKKLWLKLILCALGAASMYFILAGVRGLAGIPQSAGIMQEVTGGLPYGIFLIAAATPILAPLTEEVVFRHVLFYKFKNKLPLRVIMCLFSAFLFGAIHISNFGGELFLTVPYMVVGLVYNLIYYFSKNIWASITVHFMFNAVQSVIPVLILPFVVGIVG